MTWGQRFARLVTDAVVRQPALWPLFRRLFRRQFERLAPVWDGRRTPGHLAPLEAALAELEPPPRSVLDLGTGTGAAALAIAGRWPEAEIVGVDLAPAMVEQARRKLPPELASRVRFQVADAARLPFVDGEFDLVTLANMVTFFEELSRVVAPGGAVLLSFTHGRETPIYVASGRLREELGRRGFVDFAEYSAGAGTAFLARKSAAP